jgi:hexokinase
LRCAHVTHHHHRPHHIPSNGWHEKKLISGRYLGEILRLVICELIDEGVLFLGQNTYKIEIPYALDTAFLSLMESDPTEELLMIIGIFTHFFALETTLAERQFFRALAKLVGRRAARLSACGIAAIVSKMGYLESGCSVGADGSLYNVRPIACGDREGTWGIEAIRISEIPWLCGPCARRPARYLWRQRPVSRLIYIYAEPQPQFALSRNGFNSLAFCSNISTYHAEDGSGVGSAIIAGPSALIV